jgi:lipoyl(octanoyl) transferase
MIFKKNYSPLAYPEAIAKMEEHVKRMLLKEAYEEVWLLEHPPVYTLGTSAEEKDILCQTKVPFYKSGRGGKVAYHGPGQRIAYVMLDLSQRTQDLRHYIWMLEEWIILVLRELGVKGERREGRVGVWVLSPEGKEEKIAAIGVRIKKWVTFHGISLNINPNLSYYKSIVPCGLANYGVTSLKRLGVEISTQEADTLLERKFLSLFEE